jgi:hypothetical protein
VEAKSSQRFVQLASLCVVRIWFSLPEGSAKAIQGVDDDPIACLTIRPIINTSKMKLVIAALLASSAAAFTTSPAARVSLNQMKLKLTTDKEEYQHLNRPEVKFGSVSVGAAY